ncbi:unnamed protein product [Paramecium sonneborni]|uniref:Uncharacterized protein n=1 Tax=Paramecium sonneborni TaxID=65129 RepID=A0A8S1KG59_9CILI|nr:unnamed protein product [Paramecium sonneborni]
MLKFIKLFLPLLINSSFTILCIIYLQLKGQQSYFLLFEVTFLILAVILNIIAQFQTKQQLIKTDHSPPLFIILLLVQFCSLLYLDYQWLSENLLSLLIGGMLNLQKLKLNNQQDYIQIKKIKALLQFASLLFIIALVIITKQQGKQDIILLLLTSICFIIFLAAQLQPKKENHKQTQQMISLTQNSTIQQINSNIFSDKFFEKKILLLSLSNNEIIVEKISVYFDKYLKEKNLKIDDFLKNTQIFQISFQNENILFNQMIKIKCSLYQQIKEILNNEKLKTLSKNWKLQNQFQEDQQSKLISPNESRSQLSIIFQQDSHSFKQSTIDLGNNTIDKTSIQNEYISRSVKDLHLHFNDKFQQSQTSSITKSFGILNSDQQNYKNISFTLQNSSLIFEFEEESIDQLKQKLNDIQNQYMLAVSKNLYQRISLMMQNLKVLINQLITTNLDQKLLQQIQSQIFVINLSNSNCLYFLTDDFQQKKQCQINLNDFLNQIKSKLTSAFLLIDQNISISINDELLINKTIFTYPQYLRLIIVNLLHNSIKKCIKTSKSHEIIINLKQINNEEIQFEMIDDGGGFSEKLDYSRVLQGKLGIFVVQKLLVQISQNPILFYKTVGDETKKGNSVTFQISRQINKFINNKNYFSQNIIEQNIHNVAQIQQLL